MAGIPASTSAATPATAVLPTLSALSALWTDYLPTANGMFYKSKECVLPSNNVQKKISALFWLKMSAFSCNTRAKL